MKKIFKSPIFMFALGVVVTTSIGIGVYAISASEITYNNTTVDLALDNVYTNLNTKMAMNTFGTPKYSYVLGSGTLQTTLSDLGRGKYLVISSVSSSVITSASISEVHDEYSDISDITCGSSNCVITQLGGYQTRKQASTASTGSLKGVNELRYLLLYVEINDDTDNLILTYPESVGSKAAMSLSLAAIPINE